jgi:hypothetical protein
MDLSYNTIGLSVWSQEAEEAKVTVMLETDYVVESSWSAQFDSKNLRPSWNAERMQFA